MATAVRRRNDVEHEMIDEIGVVPSFFTRIPDDVIGDEWRLFRHWELEETLIPAKYKELLMLAVHAETKCRYCTLFHTEMARFQGATEEEIQEAVHLAKHTVGWSVYLNGIREDLDRFSQELEEIGTYVTSHAA